MSDDSTNMNSSFEAVYHGCLVLDCHSYSEHVIPWALLELLLSSETHEIVLSFKKVNLMVNSRGNNDSHSHVRLKHHLAHLVPIASRHDHFKGTFAYLRKMGPLNISPYELHAFSFGSDEIVAQIKLSIESIVNNHPKKSLVDLWRQEGQMAEPIDVLMKKGHSIFEVLFVFKAILSAKQHSQMSLDNLLEQFYNSSEGLERMADLGHNSCSSESGASLQDINEGGANHTANDTGPSGKGNRHRSGSGNGSNNTVLFDTGPISIALISTRKKTVVLERFITEVHRACRSMTRPDHFSLIVANGTSPVGSAALPTPPTSGASTPEPSFTIYVFQCADDSVAGEIYQSVVQTCTNTFNTTRRCQTCPIQRLHDLAAELAELGPVTLTSNRSLDAAVEQVLFRYLAYCDTDDSIYITRKIEENMLTDLKLNNVFTFNLLRRRLEERQRRRHVHETETGERPGSKNKTDLLTRAKRSISIAFSFTSLINKKDKPDKQPDLTVRSRSRTENSFATTKMGRHETDQSPAVLPTQRRNSSSGMSPGIQAPVWQIDSPLPDRQSSRHSSGCSSISSSGGGGRQERLKRSNEMPAHAGQSPGWTKGLKEEQFIFNGTSERRRAVSEGPSDIACPFPKSVADLSRRETVQAGSSTELIGAEPRLSSRARIFHSVVVPQSRVSEVGCTGRSSLLLTAPDHQTPAPSRRSVADLMMIWREACREVGQVVLMTRRMERQTRLRHLLARMKQGLPPFGEAEEEEIPNGQQQQLGSGTPLPGLQLLDLSPELTCALHLQASSDWGRTQEAWSLLLTDLTEQKLPGMREQIHALVRQGVPPRLRPVVWRLLIALRQGKGESAGMAADFPVPQFCKALFAGTAEWPPGEVVQRYQHLLQRLTVHQHAILIDVGRTFPQHAFFSVGGSGQIVLYNLLKAYALADPEVGYCQGLSFIAGILLLHMSEEEAFLVFLFLMTGLGMRESYLPNMSHIQLCLYQLSRLLRDRHPSLLDQLEQLDIPPSLYAAPWFLTLFATSYPLEFIVRVFDLILTVGLEAIFRVALLLIGSVESTLAELDTFEDVSDCLTNSLPRLQSDVLRRVIDEAFELNLASDLAIYAIEYSVLQEEVVTVQSAQSEEVRRLVESNSTLERRVRELSGQLETALAVIEGQAGELGCLRARERLLGQRADRLEEEGRAASRVIVELRRRLGEDVGQQLEQWERNGRDGGNTA